MVCKIFTSPKAPAHAESALILIFENGCRIFTPIFTWLLGRRVNTYVKGYFDYAIIKLYLDGLYDNSLLLIISSTAASWMSVKISPQN